jgi:hypothetical protein
MSLPSFHDTVRAMIRGWNWRDEQAQRDALLSVDAHEREFGTSDTDAHQAELDKQARASARQANPNLPETDAEKAARLEAENTRLQAQIAAQSGARPAQPAARDVTPPA